MAIFHEVARALDGGTLLDVLENLRIAGLEAYDKEAAAGVFHGFEGVAVGSDARGAGPGDPERLQLLAELDGPGLLDVESVVVEEELFDVEARGRRCTARDSRAWSRARCTDEVGTARCSG